MAIQSHILATQWVAAILAAGAVIAAGWWPLGRWRSKAERDLESARQKLDAGQWSEALQIVQSIPAADPSPNDTWQASRRLLEGECLGAASDAALRESRFRDALALSHQAAPSLGLTDAEATQRVVEAMLGELRRLSADEPESPALPELAAIIAEQKSDRGEASFWRGLYHLRRADTAAAIADFTDAHAHCHALQIDPTLYLGAVRLRDGLPREAMKHLVEANKLAPQCPLVAWQLGSALIATGGDAMLAVRALQKATGPEGLVRFLSEPARIWIDTLPRDSWIRNLVRRTGSQRTRFACPLGLDRLKDVLESARMTLAEALVDCRRAGEAATLFQDLHRTRDDLAVHRGLGIALAELGRFDDALPHLQKARAMEQSPNARTIGALALSLSQAAGDRIGNLQQAVALIASPPKRIDADWARQAGAVLTAAQSAGVAVSAKVVVDLADALVDVGAADRSAATVFDLLALRDPEMVPIAAAWLYVRAAEREGLALSNDDILFERAFADRAGMAQYFEVREWDFAAAERLYLQRLANRGPDGNGSADPRHRQEAEANLLAEAQRHLAQNRLDVAHGAIDLARKLSPDSPLVLNLLAQLAYRRGQFDASVDWLQRWSRLEPENALPMTRAALVRRRQGRLDEAKPLLARALTLARGSARAPIALAAARIAASAGQWREALGFVEESLVFDSRNAVALAARAALRIELSDAAGLAKEIEPVAELNVEDAGTQSLIAVAAYLAGEDSLATERAKLCMSDPNAAADGHFLRSLTHLRAQRTANALAELKLAVDRATGPTEESARVLLGQLAWREGQYSESLKAWQPIPTARLKSRGLDDVIPPTTFLAAISAASVGHRDEAAKWCRAAARLGFDHPKLDPMLAATTENLDVKTAVSRLEQAIESAGPRPNIVRRLARCYRQTGRLADAQKLLDTMTDPDAHLWVERGLLHLANHQVALAERAFAEAIKLDPNHEAAAINLLLCRLSLVRWAEAKAVLPQCLALASTPELQALCRTLKALMSDSPQANSDWSSEDDDAAIDLSRSVARLDTTETLMTSLVAVRGASAAVSKANDALQPLIAMQMLDRGDAAGVLKRFGPSASSAAPVLRNLLGVAAALRQDFESAVRHFQAALPADGADARVQQNLALVLRWQGRSEESIEHWRRFLGLHDRQISRPKAMREYHRRIGDRVRALVKNLEESEL